MGYPNLPIRKTLRRVLGLLTAMILRLFAFKTTIYTCKVKDEKEAANSLMVVNLVRSI